MVPRLDRLAWGTKGGDGLQLLQELRECVEVGVFTWIGFRGLER